VEVTYSNGCSVKSNIYPFNILGLSTNGSDFFVNIYPNPFHSLFNLRTNLDLPYTIELYNTLGQTIYHEVVNFSEKSMETNNLKTGIYFLKVSGNNFTKVLKIKQI
jgi:hypothetical protein